MRNSRRRTRPRRSSIKTWPSPCSVGPSRSGVAAASGRMRSTSSAGTPPSSHWRIERTSRSSSASSGSGVGAASRAAPLRRVRLGSPDLLLAPERADQPQLAFRPARHTAGFCGDLLVSVAFPLPHPDLAHLGIATPGAELLVLLGHLCGKLGRRFAADDLAQADFLAVGCRRLLKHRFAADRSAASLLPLLVPYQLERLAGSDGDQNVPQVIA